MLLNGEKQIGLGVLLRVLVRFEPINFWLSPALQPSQPVYWSPYSMKRLVVPWICPLSLLFWCNVNTVLVMNFSMITGNTLDQFDNTLVIREMTWGQSQPDSVESLDYWPPNLQEYWLGGSNEIPPILSTDPKKISPWLTWIGVHGCTVLRMRCSAIF
jgi:hypothetical protein